MSDRVDTSIVTDPQHAHVAYVPIDLLYVARLDTTALSRPTDEQRGYIFERFLPCPLDDVHVTYAQLDAHSAIACGIERATLERLLSNGSIPPGVTVLVPKSLPDCMHAEDNATETRLQLNLLRREFQPDTVRRATRRLWLQAGAALLLVAMAIAAGMERRIQRTQDGIIAARDARLAIYDEILGPTRGTGVSTSQHHARFVSELRLLRQTRGRDGTQDRQPDALGETSGADQSLAALMASWPAHLHVQTETVSVTANSITTIAQVSTMADAQELAAGFDLAKMPAWEMQQPQTRAVGDDRVRITLRFKPRSIASVREGQP